MSSNSRIIASCSLYALRWFKLLSVLHCSIWSYVSQIRYRSIFNSPEALNISPLIMSGPRALLFLWVAIRVLSSSIFGKPPQCIFPKKTHYGIARCWTNPGVKMRPQSNLRRAAACKFVANQKRIHRIATWNVQGLRLAGRLQVVEREYQRLSINVLATGWETVKTKLTKRKKNLLYHRQTYNILEIRQLNIDYIDS